MVKRRAFTFIELIFAIVIIAITVVSLPMMNQVIAKGVDANLIQEAIFASATGLNEGITGNWDEASTDASAPNSYARVIDHTGNCNNDNNSPTYRQMPGHINQPLHRKCLADSTVSPIDASNDADIDALDDMVGTTNIFTLDTGGATGYKREYTSTITVDRNVTFNTPANLNMKRITITITDSDGKTLTKLTTYSANIGEVDYLKQEY
ncbi:prepilin-type N-terminal cleavage/methylation domain-containing protein [Sulfurimonas sp. SAG-AH-194-L11]|nr:prepilin-type N-terminal cleavage/methylation domain-containing protein [Sulfurimonas sp. SAG-AH-194-L11]MDF1877883.1 prepilin-type N-terminal cleavage/methylation domain-containing protein [Sulfurimonas sp. SAG-AH-194-L11]